MKMSIPQWQKWTKEFGPRAVAAARLGLQVGAGRAVFELQRRTDQAGALDVGTFKRGWKSEPIEKGVRIFNQAPYASVIEYGRRVGATAPPTSALIPWVKRKLGVPDEKARSVAFLVAQAIQRNGIKGKHILENAKMDIYQWLLQEVSVQLGRLK